MLRLPSCRRSSVEYVSAAGRRLAVNRTMLPAPLTAINLVVNWVEELKPGPLASIERAPGLAVAAPGLDTGAKMMVNSR